MTSIMLCLCRMLILRLYIKQESHKTQQATIMMKQVSFILLCAGLLAVSSSQQSCSIANKCQCLEIPDKKLRDFHSGCNTNAKSRHPDCVAAMHRYCNNINFPWYQPDYHLTAASQEHHGGFIHFGCIKSTYERYVSLTELQLHHSSCTRTTSQSISCLAAIHRFCAANGKGGDAGLAQEVPAESIYVTCFKPSLKKSVNITELQAKHAPCTMSTSNSDNCFAAARRWCNDRGHNGGIIQEAGNNALLVACYKSLYGTNVYT